MTFAAKRESPYVSKIREFSGEKRELITKDSSDGCANSNRADFERDSKLRARDSNQNSLLNKALSETALFKAFQEIGFFGFSGIDLDPGDRSLFVPVAAT
jgi:hypothetical protein